MKIQGLGKFIFALFFAGGIAGQAQAAPHTQKDDMKAAVQAARAAAINGPANVALKDEATLKLPEGYVFIPQPQADQMLKAMGNSANPGRIGLIFPQKGGSFVVASYHDSGYVKDEEAKDWDADGLLKGLKKGAEEDNKDRAKRGIAPMEVIGWVQSPKYDASTHRLLWSIETKDKGAPADDDHGINYNTYILGREGYLSLNLVTSMAAIGQDKSIAATLLNSTSFNSGKTYTDFNASTDKVAKYGIAALVAGIAAKKLGLFAVIAAFVAKFAKVIFIALLGLFPGLRKYFGKKKGALGAPAGGAGDMKS